MVACDEDTLDEMRNFKKCLILMFDKMDQASAWIVTTMMMMIIIII